MKHINGAKVIQFQSHMMRNFNIFWFHSLQSRKSFKIRSFLKNPKIQILTNSYCSRSSRLCQHSLFYQVIELQNLVFPSGRFTFASSGFSNTTSVFYFPGQELLICRMPKSGTAGTAPRPHTEHPWLPLVTHGTGATACHTSGISKMLGLPLFFQLITTLLTSAAQSFLLTVCMFPFPLWLHQFNDTTETFINTHNQILPLKKHWGRNQLH